MRRLSVLFLLLGLPAADSAAQALKPSGAVSLARVKYAGGGDWYNDPSAEPNLLAFLRKTTGVEVDPRYRFVEIGSEDFFAYPLLFLTGHGNIVLSDTEARRLRTHLENGGFLYIDDDYGLDRAVRRELKKVFPGQEPAELPFDHGIYRTPFSFPAGPPKTHEHDAKPPQGYGLFHRGRLVVYYTVEANPSDGWADPDVHNDPEEKRQEALRFGTNILVWALTH